MLAERTRAWYTEQRRVSHVQSSAALTQWKRTPELAFLNELSPVPLQQAPRHPQTTFTWRDGCLTLAKTSQSLDIVWSCSQCGAIAERLPLGVREWACDGCGAHHDRDVNAARNVLAAGLAVSACGAGVRPQRESSRTGQSAMKQENHGVTRGISRPRVGEEAKRRP